MQKQPQVCNSRMQHLRVEISPRLVAQSARVSGLVLKRLKYSNASSSCANCFEYPSQIFWHSSVSNSGQIVRKRFMKTFWDFYNSVRFGFNLLTNPILCCRYYFSKFGYYLNDIPNLCNRIHKAIRTFILLYFFML